VKGSVRGKALTRSRRFQEERLKLERGGRVTLKILGKDP
jgi:hypothetical protein